MGRILYQYGTAAHLALLTAAPLFLSLFCGPVFHAMALLGLSLFAVLWVLMNPSARFGEWPRDARRRIGWELVRDPFLSFGVVTLVLSAVCAINGGVSIGYDAASGLWQLKDPAVPQLPGSVTGSGVVPLAGIFALLVAVLGVRHALGSSARFAFLFLSGAFSAVVAVCGRIFPTIGSAAAGAGLPPETALSDGTFLGIYFILAIVAWVGSWSFRSALLELVCSIAASVLLAGLLSSAPTYSLFVFLPLGLLCVSAGVALSVVRRPPAAWFRTVLSLSIILIPVAALATGLIDRQPLWPVWSKSFLAFRSAAVSVALEAWRQSPQLGVGVGGSSLALRLFATPEDWRIFPETLSSVPCGWIQFLLERGIFGAIVFLAGLAILARDMIRRYIRSDVGWAFGAQQLVGLFVAIGAAAILFADSCFAQIDALIPVGAALALSAAAFPDSKEDQNG